MELTSGSMPEENGKGWQEELSALGEQLKFSLESSDQPGPPLEPSRVLTLVSLYHKNDKEHWFEVCRHLQLLEVPGHHLKFRNVALSTDTENEFVELLMAKTHLNEAHLVLLILSVDLVTTLLQREQIGVILRADAHPLILPIALRPVLWSCPFPTIIRQVPKEAAVTLWINRDHAHVTIAQRVKEILEMVVAEDAHEEDNDAH